MFSRKKPITKLKSVRRKERKILKSRVVFESGDSYKGVKIVDFQDMTLEETISLMSSSIRRTYSRMLKGKAAILFNKLISGKDMVKTHCREFPILPQFIGKTVLIHNGKKYHELKISEMMVGHRLGEFSPTTVTPKHKKMGIGGSKSSRKIATAKT